MKTSKKYLYFAAVIALATSSCSENAWNDHLDGFDVPPIAGGVVTVDYELTAADYATIAGLAANKTIAAENGQEAALEAIGTNGCFANDNEAKLYIPALLANASSGLPYYTYNNGSSVNIGYAVSSALPEDVKSINAGTLIFAVGEEEYQQVWGSSTDFIEAFTPSKSPAANLPKILSNNLTASAGQYAVTTYNFTTTEPNFETPAPAFEETDIAGTANVDEDVTIRGYVTAIDSRGFIVADKSGAILCYQASGFDQNAVEIGNQITVSGKVSAYNKGIQIGITSDSYSISGKGTFTYPAPVEVDGPAMDAAITATDNFHPQYVTFVGKLAISGNYYNVNVDGAETAIGSLYMVPDYIKEQLTNDQTYRFTGYFMAISGGKYYNLVVTSVQSPTAKVRRVAADGAVQQAALYKYNGSAWTAATGIILIQPTEYKEVMGLGYANMSGNQPDQYLPLYLKQTFPYAQEGDTKTVVYYYYASGASAYQARQYEFNGSDWKRVTGNGALQFTRMNGEWKFNPSVEITLPYSRNTDPSYTYYMACVNWVLDNIVKPNDPSATLTTATPLIDYRGNAEFYSGASAYYGNVDVRASTALSNSPDGYYDGLSDDQITALVKKRFCLETMRGAIEKLHSDMKPEEGMEVTITIHFTSYAPAATEETLVYTVTGPGQFTYKSCTWFTNGEDADWQ